MARDYDVVVCGGGLTGVAAAVGAARCGARTLLIERYGFLGGMATNGLVHPFMTYFAGDEQIIHGVFQEILNGLKARGGFKPRFIFDSEIMKIVLDDMILKSGVDILFHTFVVDADVKDDTIRGVWVEHKSGRERISGSVIIDSTGDGDVAARSGAPFQKGREEDGLMQPMTLNFRMGNVDRGRMPGREEITELYLSAKKRGEINNPREDVLWFDTIVEDIVHFNTTRIIKRDSTDVDDLTSAEMEARRQVWDMVSFLRKYVPGFEDAYLLTMAPQIGPRESRRVIGEYVMTAEDILEARKFEDVIARGSYSIDIHNPAGTGTVIKRLKPGTSYDIPYRSLIPKEIEGLIVAGRCISSTHEAHSSIRIMPICTAIGHAAGVAAGLSISKNTAPRDLDVTALQRELLRQGANLGRKM
ncbi:MAG: FAD-dependent oxidoreductase [bacterium]